MASNKKTDLQRSVTFFGPHPGFMGAAIPLPEPIRQVAESLDGQTMTLRQALRRLRQATDGELDVIAEHKIIMLRLKPKSGKYLEHVFRLIRYR